MDVMKPYKTVLVVELKDWTKLYSEKTKAELMQYLDKVSNWNKICDIDGVIFDRREFKKAYELNIDWVDAYILTFTKDIQDKLRQREREKKWNIGRWFDDIEEIDNYLKSKNLVAHD